MADCPITCGKPECLPGPCAEDAAFVNAIGKTCAEVLADDKCGFVAESMGLDTMADCPITCGKPECLPDPCAEDAAFVNAIGKTCAEVFADDKCGFVAESMGLDTMADC